MIKKKKVIIDVIFFNKKNFNNKRKYVEKNYLTFLF